MSKKKRPPTIEVGSSEAPQPRAWLLNGAVYARDQTQSLREEHWPIVLS